MALRDAIERIIWNDNASVWFVVNSDKWSRHDYSD